MTVLKRHINCRNSNYSFAHTETDTQTHARLSEFFLNKRLLCFTATEYKGQNLAGAEDDSIERSPVAKADNLQKDSIDMEKPRTSAPQQLEYANKSHPIREHEEDDAEDGEKLECMEWNLAVTDSIELKCLSELEIILKRKLEDVEEDEWAIHEKLKTLKQRMMCMSKTIDELKSTLENERVKLKEVEKERDVMVDHAKDNDSNEQKLNKMVEDLKSQVSLLNDLIYGCQQQATKGESVSSLSALFTWRRRRKPTEL